LDGTSGDPFMWCAASVACAAVLATSASISMRSALMNFANSIHFGPRASCIMSSASMQSRSRTIAWYDSGCFNSPPSM
jgi:hypothetical protein